MPSERGFGRYLCGVSHSIDATAIPPHKAMFGVLTDVPPRCTTTPIAELHAGGSATYPVTAVHGEPPARDAIAAASPPPRGRMDAMGYPWRVSSSDAPIALPARELDELLAPRPPRQRGAPFVSLLSALGLVSFLASAGLFVWGAMKWRELADQARAAAVAEPEGTRRTNHPGADQPSASTAVPEKPAPPPSVPAQSRVDRIGAIEVVDVGLGAPALTETLATQSKLAAEQGQTVLLMVTGGECSPCRSIETALGEPLMQQALRNVRLVRVDLRVFKEELADLRMQTNVFPIFALLADDMTPRDAIHGGEWDEDVAANIAPVLGEFVRGSYRSRRNPEWSPTPGGMRL